MKIYIKNMVCGRCKMVVKQELEKFGLHPLEVALGEITLKEENMDAVKEPLLQSLRQLGFDFIDDKKSRTIEKIKNRIVYLVQEQNNQLTTNLSDYLSEQLQQEYSTLSKLFSEVESTTIEQFYIQHKVEKIKELLMYDELTLSEIAYRLNYSSVAHLSNQFKKVTGFSPSYFKQLKDLKRRQIEEL